MPKQEHYAGFGANPGGQNNLIPAQATCDGQGHLYLAGNFTSQNAHVGGFTLTNAGPLVPPPTGPAPPNPNTDRYLSDAFVARLDTAGTWQWAVRRGGQYNDWATAPTLDGTGRLWVRYNAAISPNQLSGLSATTGAWNRDYTLPAPLPTAFCLAGDQSGRLHLAGAFTDPSMSLGVLTIPNVGTNLSTGYVARLGQLPLATQLASSVSASLQAWPTPGLGTSVWVQGATAGQPVEVFDIVGRRLGGGQMPATGPLWLSWPGAGLAPGVYLVRGGGLSCRWVVE